MSLPLPEYDDLDATGLAELVRRREVQPSELLDAALARLDARNPALNAVVCDLRERARAESGALPEGPLRGVPFLLKDLKAMLKGTPTTDSCKLYAGRIADHSTVLVERYLAAGVQVIGKTSTPEMGIMGVTEPALRGPCRNPWDTDRSPGGSSGGSAAAVAARIVPAAHGGDGGGSLRIPASCCGLVGLKPTRGRITMAPHRAESWQGFVQEHVLTRSVRDCALLLDLTAKDTPGEPYVAPPPGRPWLDEVGADPGRLRIALHRGALFGDDISEDSRAAVDDAAALLADLGHEVVEDVPAFDRDLLIRCYLLTVASGVACAVEDAAAYAGSRPRASGFEASTWMLALIGWKSSAAEIVRARHTIQAAGRDIARFFGGYDLMLTSTTGTLPPVIGSMDPSSAEKLQLSALRMAPLKPLLDIALEKMGSGRLSAVPNTQLFNLTGQPAVSVPLHWSAQGLPVGVQLAARFGDEATLLRVAAQLEAARPWAHRKPPGL